MIHTNTINIHGRLTRDPEIKYLNDDKAVCEIAVAVDRSFKQEGKTNTDFFNCVCYNKLAETINKYFNKGDGISLQGEMQNNRYKDKEDKWRDKWQVRIDKFDFEFSKKGESQSTQTTPDSTIPEGFTAIDENSEDEDLPF